MSTSSVGGGEGWGVCQSILISRDGTWGENRALCRWTLVTLRKCVHLDVTPWQQVESSSKNDKIRILHIFWLFEQLDPFFPTQISARKRARLPGGYKHDTSQRKRVLTQKTHTQETQRGCLSFDIGNPARQRGGLAGSSWKHQETNMMKATWLPITPKTMAQGKLPGAQASSCSLSLEALSSILFPTTPFPACLKGPGPTPM